jgi:hypothetical protein
MATWPAKVIRTFARAEQRVLLLRLKRGQDLFVIERRERLPERSFRFSDITTLIKFENELIEDLSDAGWSLIAFWPERRSGTERRHSGRNGPDRRRAFRPPPS